MDVSSTEKESTIAALEAELVRVRSDLRDKQEEAKRALGAFESDRLAWEQVRTTVHTRTCVYLYVRRRVLSMYVHVYICMYVHVF